MTAALASPTVPLELSPPRPRTVSGGNEPFVTSWAASSAPPVVERALLDVALPAAESAGAEKVVPAASPIAEFTRFVLTQWMAAFVTYEVLAATIDRKGRYLRTVGL